VDLLLLVAAAGVLPRIVATFALARLRQCSERRAYYVVQRLLAEGAIQSWDALDQRAGGRRTTKDLLTPGPAWDETADRLQLPERAMMPQASQFDQGPHLLGMALLRAAAGPYTVHADANLLDVLERMPRGGPMTSRSETIGRQQAGDAPSPHKFLVPGSLLGAVPVHSHAWGSPGVTEPALLFVGNGATTASYLAEAMSLLTNHGPFVLCVPGSDPLCSRQDLSASVHARMNLVRTLGLNTVMELGGRTDATRAHYFAQTRDAVSLAPMDAEMTARFRDNLERLIARYEHRRPPLG